MYYKIMFKIKFKGIVIAESNGYARILTRSWEQFVRMRGINGQNNSEQQYWYVVTLSSLKLQCTRNCHLFCFFSLYILCLYRRRSLLCY